MDRGRSAIHPLVEVLELMRIARQVKSIQVINGLKRGLIARALDGEHVGTIISAA